MSVSPKGQYTNFVVFDEAKRYYILQAQRNKPLLDEEVRELNLSLLAQVSRLTTSLMGDVASPLETFSSPPGNSGPNNALKVVQSATDPINNFTVTGGAGIKDPAILYLDGYRIFLKGDLEYAAQSATLLPGESLSDALKRDNYTTTPIPGLTTPGSDRTDLVYLDLSFAEVTADTAGSEYTDPSIKDAVIGTSTANRLRAVIDVRVYQAWPGATNANVFTDPFFGTHTENQVEHHKCPIALIRRTAMNPAVLTGMVTDLLTLHDRRILTPKEVTHLTRHGGYTDLDVTAGRANSSDVSETWGATGRNEGFGTEALNTSAVTPRTVSKSGNFKIRSLVAGGSTGTIQPDAELLATGETVAETTYANKATVGYGQPFAGARGETGGVVQSTSVFNAAGSAFHARADVDGQAYAARNGYTGGTLNFEVRGDGRTAIKGGVTGPLTDFDVNGSASVYTDLSIGRNTFVGSHLGVTGTSSLNGFVTVGGSGMSILGDLGVTGKSNLEGFVTVGWSGAQVKGDLTVLGKSTLTGFVQAGGSGMSILGDLGVTGRTNLEGFVTVGYSGAQVKGDFETLGKSLLDGAVTVGGSGLASLGAVSAGTDLDIGRNAQIDGNLGVSGIFNLLGQANLASNLHVSGQLRVDQAAGFGAAINGTDFTIPAGQLSSSNPAVFGNVAPFATTDLQNSVQADRGYYAEGATGAWGSFAGGSEGTVGFKLGGGNSIPGMGVVRGWTKSSMNIMLQSNLLRRAVSIADDPSGAGVYVGINDAQVTNPLSVVWVSRTTGEIRVLANGIRSLSCLVADQNGFLWASSATATYDNYAKLFKLTPSYGSDGLPSTLTVESQDLSHTVGSVSGVTVLAAPIYVPDLALTMQVGWPIIIWQDVPTNKGKISVVNVDDANTLLELCDVGVGGKAVTNGTLGPDGTPTVYFLLGTDPTHVNAVDPLTRSMVSVGDAGTPLLNANTLHLGTDRMLYVGAPAYTTGNGKVWRVGPGSIYEVMYQGMDANRGILTDANRQMYLAEYGLGNLWRRPLPGSVVVHMDKAAVASPYAFPGDVALVPDAREAVVETFGADVLTVHAAALKVDAQLVATQDAFFGKDIYVAGRTHQDAFSTGEISAASVVVGATGAVNALDVWGDSVISRVLVIGASPDSTVAAQSINRQTTTSGTTVGLDVVGYAFGEFQAYDYRATGQLESLGIYSVESQDGHMAAWLGGDAVAPYNGATGTSGGSGGSGLSGIGRTVGIHLIEADTLVVDKNAGSDAAFMQVMGDLEVVRELTVRSIHHSAIGPEGVEIVQSGAVTADKTRMLVKDFAMNTPAKLRGFEIQGVVGTQENWGNNSRGPMGATGAPALILPAKGLDKLVVGRLGQIKMEWKAATTVGIDVGASSPGGALAISTMVSYKFFSDVLGDQDWMGSASFYPSAISIRADIVERGGARGYAESCHVQKSFQVYIDPQAWRSDFVQGTTAYGQDPDALLGLYTYRPYLSPYGGSGVGEHSALQNSVNRAWAARDVAIDGSGNSLVGDTTSTPDYVKNSEFLFVRGAPGTSGGPDKTTDWVLALLPTFRGATKRNLGASTEFNYIGTWDLEVVLVPLKDKWVSNVIGQLQLADAVGTPAWSSSTPPWTQRADLPWVDPAELFDMVTGDKFIWEQPVAADTWTINHNLGGYPAVEVMDTLGNVITADVQYLTPDTLQISFSGVPVAGRASLN